MQLKPMVENITQQTTELREEPVSAQQRVNDEEYNYQYYQQYKRLYQTSYLLSIQLKQLNQTKDDLWLKINRLQKKTQDFKDDIRGQIPDRKKRFRRTAETIERKYICQVQKCNKCYGSQGSLQQHIKLKHPQLYQSKSNFRKLCSDADQEEERSQQ